MSVRKGDQGEGDLQVINASRLLLDYTYDRVKDKNIFPKAERWLLPKSIWDCAIGARKNIIHANGIRVESRADAEERILSEKKAIGMLEELEALIDLCDLKDKVSGDRAAYWTKLSEDTMIPLRGWLKSDKQRYKEFLK